MNQALLDLFVEAANAEVASLEEMAGYCFDTPEKQKRAFNTALVELIVKKCANILEDKALLIYERQSGLSAAIKEDVLVETASELRTTFGVV